MKSLFVTLCIASLTATFAACVLDPQEPAEDIEESQSALFFAPNDPDITWSGPATYSAGWAQQSFKPNPGVYIVNLGSNVFAGAVYLSATVLCTFSSFEETSNHLFIHSSDCSGPFNNLTVNLDCVKSSGNLTCTGGLATAGGLQSGLSGMIARESVCGQDNCDIGPLDPMPPGPDGPADCGEGESPCGRGCCLRGERCGNSKCYIPDKEDEAVGGRD